jgi:hypothetical protein
MVLMMRNFITSCQTYLHKIPIAIDTANCELKEGKADNRVYNISMNNFTDVNSQLRMVFINNAGDLKNNPTTSAEYASKN